MKRYQSMSTRVYRRRWKIKKPRRLLRFFLLLLSAGILFLAVTSWRLQQEDKQNNNVVDNEGGIEDMPLQTNQPEPADNQPDSTVAPTAMDTPKDWRLLLVNHDNPLPADYSVGLAKVQGQYQADERIADFAVSMIQDARKEGVDLLICSSYRSVSRQQELFDEEVEKYIAGALAPAEVLSVAVDESGAKACRVIVPDSQLSLAIGNKGQNVRLAARLTGWKIDIHPESGFYGEADDSIS